MQLRRSSNVGNNLLRDSAIHLDNNLVDHKRRLDGIRLTVHPLKLLESASLSFNARGTDAS